MSDDTRKRGKLFGAFNTASMAQALLAGAGMLAATMVVSMNANPLPLMSPELVKRFAEIKIAPIGTAALQKIAEKMAGKELGAQPLTAEQHKVAMEYILSHALENHDPTKGARDISRRIKNLAVSDELKQLMTEHSDAYRQAQLVQRGVAVATAAAQGSKSQSAAPSTARFKQKRAVVMA